MLQNLVQVGFHLKKPKRQLYLKSSPTRFKMANIPSMQNKGSTQNSTSPGFDGLPSLFPVLVSILDNQLPNLMVSSHLLVYFHNDVCQLRESLEILNFENKTKMSLINSQDSLRNFSKFSFSVIEIGFRLYNSRTSNVKNTCVVALRRIVSIVSDSFLQIHNSKVPLESSQNVFQNLIELLTTITLHIESAKKNPQCLIIYSFSRNMVLTLLSQLLTNVEDAVLPYEEITRIMNYKLVHLLQTLISTKTKDYILCVRLFKCIILINLNLGIGYGLLRCSELHLAKFLSLEGLSILSGSRKFLIKCHDIEAFGSRNISNFEESVFTLLTQVQTASNLVVKAVQNDQPLMLPLKLSRLRDANFIDEPPPCDGLIAFRLSSKLSQHSVQLLANLIESLGVMVEESNLKIGYLTQHAFTAEQMNCKRMIRCSWEPILKILTTAIKVSRDESIEQTLFNSEQKFVSICGSIDELSTRDTMLTNLCQYCTPQSGTTSSDSKLDSKNILAIKTLLNISHCLGSILDTKAWFIILETFQKIQFYLAQQETRRLGIKSTKIDFAQIQSRIRKSMERFSDQFVEKLRMQKYNPNTGRMSPKPKLKRAVSLLRGKSDEQNVKSDGPESHQYPRERNNNDAETKVIKEVMLEEQEQEKKSPFSIKSESAMSTPAKEADSMREINENVIDYSKRLHQRIMSITNFGFFSDIVGKQRGMPQKDSFQSIDSEYGILESSIDSLFISSLLFDEESLKDLLVALGQINLNSLDQLAKEEGTLSVAKYKMHVFGVLKMFEVGFANSSRYANIWNIMVTHFEGLANSDIEFIRSIAVEAVVALVTHIFRQRQTEGRHLSSEQQSQVLQAFNHLIKASYQDTQIIVLKSLPQFLRDCGSQLSEEAWRVLLMSLHHPPQEQLHMNHIYNCADIIVHEHLVDIRGLNFVSLIDLMHVLSSYDEGSTMNVPLNSMNIFYDLADALGKRLNEMKAGKTESDPPIPDIWVVMLDKLRDLGHDPRQEVRESAVHAIESALVKHCSKMDFNLASTLIESNVIALVIDTFKAYTDSKKMPEQYSTETEPASYGRSSGELADSIAQEGGLHAIPTSLIPSDSPTPKFSHQPSGGSTSSSAKEGRVMRFDQEFLEEYSKKKTVKEIKWDDTCIKVMQTAIQIIKNMKPAKWDSEDPQTIVKFSQNLWKNLLANLRSLLKAGSSDLNHKALNVLKDSLVSLYDLALRCFTSTFSVFEELKEWISGPFHDRQTQRKALHTKVSAVVYQNFKILILKPQSLKAQPQIIETRTCKTILDIINKFLDCAQESEGLLGFSQPQKLGQEEKMLFQMIEDLAQVYCPPEPTRQLYKRELLSLMTYYQSVPHSDHFIRASFEIIERRIHEGYFLRLNQIKEIVDRCIHILKLRYNELVAQSPFGVSKALKPLWCLAGHQYLKLVQLILQAPKQLTPDQEEQIAVEDDVKEYVWESVLPIIEKYIVLNTYELRDMNKSLLEIIYQFSQELDMEVTTLAIKVLLPLCKDKELQKQFVRLIDNGCNAEYGHNSEFSNKNYSTFCLNNLFTLCQQLDPNEGIADTEIREELAKLSAPVLIKRCREMIEMYIMDERRTGSMSMKRSRITEMIFVLEKLKNLDLVEGCLTKEGGKREALIEGKKAHLMLLMPLLSHCVTSKELEIRDKLKDIFLSISDELHIPPMK